MEMTGQVEKIGGDPESRCGAKGEEGWISLPPPGVGWGGGFLREVEAPLGRETSLIFHSLFNVIRVCLMNHSLFFLFFLELIPFSPHSWGAAIFYFRCVLAELKRLGNSYFQALEAAHQLFTASCDHEKIKSADVCIADVIGQINPEHFFVATQDSDLRKKFQEIPGVPVIFGLRKSLFLEPPSAFQRQFVKTSEEARLHMTELDRKMLQKWSRNMSVDEEANNSSDENEKKRGIQDERKPPTVWEAMRVKDKVQFKRKKAKAPNPLSCKKKNREEPKLVLEKEKKDGKNSVRSRIRKRKRSHRGKKIAEKDG